MERIREEGVGRRVGCSRRSALRLCGLAVPALAAPALLTGCGAPSAASAGNVLRVSQPGDPKTMDPHKQGDMTSMNALINIFDTLTTRGRDNTLQPRIAVSWKAVEPKVWRFELRRGVTFHNGEPCDAEAVRFSIKRLLAPTTKSPIVELRYVEDVSVVDRYTVDVHTSVHDPILPAKLSLFGGVVVPPRYLAEVGDEGSPRTRSVPGRSRSGVGNVTTSCAWPPTTTTGTAARTSTSWSSYPPPTRRPRWPPCRAAASTSWRA